MHLSRSLFGSDSYSNYVAQSCYSAYQLRQNSFAAERVEALSRFQNFALSRVSTGIGFIHALYKIFPRYDRSVDEFLRRNDRERDADYYYEERAYSNSSARYRERR